MSKWPKKARAVAKEAAEKVAAAVEAVDGDMKHAHMAWQGRA